MQTSAGAGHSEDSAETVQFAKTGRPQNLRKKTPQEGTAEQEEEDLVQIREAITATRLRETYRSANLSLSGGGVAKPWQTDGFLQWSASISGDLDPSSTVRTPIGMDARGREGGDNSVESVSARDGAPPSPAMPEAEPEHVDEGWQDELKQCAGLQEWEPLDGEVEKLLMARGLKAVMSAEKGRCIIATRPFKVGEIIVEQEPLAWALFPHGQEAKKWTETSSSLDVLPQPSPSHLVASAPPTPTPPSALRCHYCLRTHANLRRCATCKFAHYCSAAHQKNDWPTHSSDCSRRAKSDPKRFPTSMVTMLAQLHDIKLAAARPNPPPLLPPGRRLQDLDTLAAHYSALSSERLTGYAQVAMAWSEYMGYSEENPPPPDDLRNALVSLCRMTCNSHTITDSDLREIGVGIFPAAALINHSCTPTAVQTFAGRTLRVRAIQALNPQDEVTISYLDLADPLHLRHKELEERYFFKCACPLCALAAQDATALPAHELDKEAVTASGAHVQIALDLAATALALEEGRPADPVQTVHARLEFQMQAIAACEAALHPHHTRLLRLREAASRLAIQVCVYVCVCMYVCVYIGVYIYAYTCRYVYIHICIYIYIYVYI